MKEGAKLGTYKVLGIDVIDRSTRGGAKMLEPLFDYLIGYGVRIEIGGIPIDYKTPEGRFSNNVQAEAVRLAKEIIVRNMINGKYAKANRGILIGCYPPWGYKLIKRDREKGIEAHFEVDNADAWNVQKMFEVYMDLQNLNQAVKKLEEMGIYARGKKGEEGKFKVQILPGTLKQYLQNEAYIGNFWFGKKKYCRATRFVKEYSKTRERGLFTGWKFRPRSEWKLVKIPPIIDEETFNLVQNMIKIRSKNYLRRPKYDYLLQGLIKCIHCGRPYRGKPCGRPFHRKDGTIGRYFRYICYNRHEYKQCPSVGVNLRIIENTVWSIVEKYINDPEAIKKATEENEKTKNTDKVKNQKILGKLLNEVEVVKKKKSNLLDLLADDKFSKQEIYDKVDPLNTEEELLNRQVGEIRRKIITVEELSHLMGEIQKSCNSYHSDSKNANFELKKRIVRDWVKEINILDDGSFKIKLRVPRVAGVNINQDAIYTSLSLNTGKKMDFVIKNIQKNIVGVARELCYVIIDTKDNAEYNLVRKLNYDNYPRFHAYVTQHGQDFEFSLHLDQKRPIYEGTHAHNGEYFGPVVEAEADRIKEILNKHD